MDEITKKMLFISRNMAGKNYKLLKEKGMTKIGIGQMPMAKMILDNPGLYADDISKELELDKATVALGLKRLLVGGLIKRELDENDKRKKKLYPTNKLLNSEKLVMDHVNISIKRLTEGFTKNELGTLNHYLDRMKENLMRDDF